MDWLLARPLLGVDIETTGLDTRTDRPVRVGMSWLGPHGHRVPDGLPFDVHPGEDRLPMDPAVIAIHGVDDDRARAGEPLPDAVNRAVSYILAAVQGGAVVVGANVRFDLTVLHWSALAAGVPTLAHRAAAAGVVVDVVDPMLIDRAWDPDRPGRRRLVDLCERYGVEHRRPHDPTADAAAAVDVALALARLVGRPHDELGELAADPWSGQRLAELRACRTPGELTARLRAWAPGVDARRGVPAAPWPVDDAR